MTMAKSFADETDAFFEDGFSDSPRMAIFRGASVPETVRLCNLAWDRGVKLVEVPYQDDESLAALEAAVAEGQRRGFPVGAGTVLTPDQVERVASVGGAFCVSPGIDAEVTAACERAGLPHLPGVATSTEVATAWRLGYYWLKAFPASELGAAWIKAVRAPFPMIKFVCTGGMSESNAADFLAAGARGVAIGGNWAP